MGEPAVKSRPGSTWEARPSRVTENPLTGTEFKCLQGQRRLRAQSDSDLHLGSKELFCWIEYCRCQNSQKRRNPWPAVSSIFKLSLQTRMGKHWFYSSDESKELRPREENHQLKGSFSVLALRAESQPLAWGPCEYLQKNPQISIIFIPIPSHAHTVPNTQSWHRSWIPHY